jgi:hypothetical protein
MIPIILSIAAGAASLAQVTPDAAPIPDLSADLHFHTPDEIVPAVLPYLACLYASRGLPLLNGTDRQSIASRVGLGGDCTAVRHQADRDAVALLHGRPSAVGNSPQAVVDDTLTSMDNYVGALAAQRSASGWGDLPAVSGSMVMIEDEVLPAYKKYNDCLRARTLDTSVTSANVLGKFRRALPACAEARAASVEEATEALVVKGWDLARRKRTAATTFKKADESWASLGQRLYQALQRREGGKTPASRASRPRKSQ